MLLYHQIGHNYVWNIASHIEDNTGDGLIFSPVNVPSEKLIKEVPNSIKSASYFDPQFYLINQPKSKLSTYSYFPGNIKNDFGTDDLEKTSAKISYNCLKFQQENTFKYLVIPARYFDNFPTKYYDQYYELIISPFIKFYSELGLKNKLLLTLIIKPEQLVDQESISSIMNWITSIHVISGVYLIFENNYTSKQIKNPVYLYNAMLFIHFLKMNQLEVHIGYTNTEGFLYSTASPNSITMGSYDNLRSFNIDRFIITEKKKRMAPNPRLYIGELLQWVDYSYLSAIIRLYDKFNEVFDDTRYKPLMFKSDYNWHFTKPEPYKHFFIIFTNQIKSIPADQNECISFVENKILTAIERFKEISNSGILLDDNSDGSHLPHWLNALNMFKKYRAENNAEF